MSATTAPARFCKDCRWIEQRDPANPLGQRDVVCGHPSAIRGAEIDPVTGEQTGPRKISCWLERTLGHCGPEGKHWEPAEIGFGDP